MENPRFSGLDPARSRLRATVATLEKEISLVTGAAGDGDAKAPAALLAAWTDLVGQLALGTEPELRACPGCHHEGMRDAKICSNCWVKLPPLSA